MYFHGCFHESHASMSVWKSNFVVYKFGSVALDAFPINVKTLRNLIIFSMQQSLDVRKTIILYLTCSRCQFLILFAFHNRKPLSTKNSRMFQMFFFVTSLIVDCFYYCKLIFFYVSFIWNDETFFVRVRRLIGTGRMWKISTFWLQNGQVGGFKILNLFIYCIIY